MRRRAVRSVCVVVAASVCVVVLAYAYRRSEESRIGRLVVSQLNRAFTHGPSKDDFLWYEAGSPQMNPAADLPRTVLRSWDRGARAHFQLRGCCVIGSWAPNLAEVTVDVVYSRPDGSSPVTRRECLLVSGVRDPDYRFFLLYLTVLR